MDRTATLFHLATRNQIPIAFPLFVRYDEFFFFFFGDLFSVVGFLRLYHCDFYIFASTLFSIVIYMIFHNYFYDMLICFHFFSMII